MLDRQVQKTVSKVKSLGHWNSLQSIFSGKDFGLRGMFGSEVCFVRSIFIFLHIFKMPQHTCFAIFSLLASQLRNDWKRKPA